MGSVALFCRIVLVTFLQGFQNKNINGDHYILAAITSLLLGSAGVLLYKLMPTASNTEIAAYVLAGPVGVLSSMLIHNRLVTKAKTEFCPNCGSKRHEETKDSV